MTISRATNLEKSVAYLNILSAVKKIKNNLCNHGLYQYQNALTALCMLQESQLLASTNLNAKRHSDTTRLTIENALDGIQKFYWPGRFQIIEAEQIILDGAHNPAGITALRESLDYLFPDMIFHFIFACYHDKDGLIMLSNLLKPGDQLYLVDLPGRRTFFSQSKLAEHANALGCTTSIYSDISTCLSEAKRNCKASEFIVAAGSFVLLRELMQLLGWRTVEVGLN